MDKLLTENQKPPEKFPKIDQIEFGSDGWLSPGGDYYKVETTQHDESAKYIVKNSDEVKDLEGKMIDNVGQRMSYAGKPYREKLKQLGYILIRGEILRTEEEVNYTPEQLGAISKAGIKIVSAFDGSVEYNPKKILDRVQEVIEKLRNDHEVKSIQFGLDKGGYLPWMQRARAETIEDIGKLSHNPFKTVVHVDEFYKPEIYDKVPDRIFDILSTDYADEMRITVTRSEFTLRLVDLSGEKLLIQREKYTHDGLGGFLYIENSISMFVIDNLSFGKKLSKLLGVKRSNPKIEFENKNGYFAEIVTNLVSKS